MFKKNNSYTYFALLVFLLKATLIESYFGSCFFFHGGCPSNTYCIEDSRTNQVSCKCLEGLVNVGTENNVQCRDICSVNNGGCHPNAICSHFPRSSVALCTCKDGYVNVGTGTTAICQRPSDIIQSTVTSTIKNSDNINLVCRVGYTQVLKNGQFTCIDSCRVDNGDCGINENCAHDQRTYAVVCIPKSGNTNGGSTGSNNTSDSKTTGKIISQPSRRPSKPIQFNGGGDVHVITEDDDLIRGIIKVKSCRPSIFSRKPSRISSVFNHLQSLLDKYLRDLKIVETYQVQFDKVGGIGENAQFHYTVSCPEAKHEAVINGLRYACQQKSFYDILMREKQPVFGESSSESGETH